MLTPGNYFCPHRQTERRDAISWPLYLLCGLTAIVEREMRPTVQKGKMRPTRDQRAWDYSVKRSGLESTWVPSFSGRECPYLPHYHILSGF